MEPRARPTDQRAISKAFGGRSGMVSEEMDRGGRPAEVMSRGERSAARLLWIESHNHYEDYESDNRFRINRLLPSTELMVAAAIVVFFFGSYAAFIAYLALTR